MENKVFISGFSRDADESATIKFIKKFGDPREIMNSGKGYVFVTFDTAGEMQKFADKINGEALCGQRVRVEMVKPKERNASGGGGCVVSDENKVYLTISRDADESATSEFIKKYGNTQTIINTGKGYSFAKFDTAGEMQAFLNKINGEVLCGQRVRADISKSKPMRGGGVYNNVDRVADAPPPKEPSPPRRRKDSRSPPRKERRDSRSPKRRNGSPPKNSVDVPTDAVVMCSVHNQRRAPSDLFMQKSHFGLVYVCRPESQCHGTTHSAMMGSLPAVPFQPYQSVMSLPAPGPTRGPLQAAPTTKHDVDHPKAVPFQPYGMKRDRVEPLDVDHPKVPKGPEVGAKAEEAPPPPPLVRKWNAPPDLALPTDFPLPAWSFVVIRGGLPLAGPEGMLSLHSRAVYVIGQDPSQCDVVLQHPSVSRHHAVVCHRRRPKGITLYLIDTDSSNGTTINGTRTDPRRYYELLDGDIVKFGASTRDCVLTKSSNNLVRESSGHAKQ